MDRHDTDAAGDGAGGNGASPVHAPALEDAGTSENGCCPLCDTAPKRVRRGVTVLLAVVLGVAATGFFVGIRGSATAAQRSARTDAAALPAVEAAAPPAVPYREMDARARGPNAAWENRLDKLATTRPGLFDPVTNDPADKAATLAGRRTNRAFDGAPPTVPHPITQQTAESCLACHRDGTRVTAAVVAPKVSHPLYANCTQCHVESDNQKVPLALNDGRDEQRASWAANAFAGRPSPDAGDRAWQGAPPVIPHATQMRNDCTSCHGLTGDAGIRTTHPWRNNCTQCHAPAATLDQQPWLVKGKDER